MTIRCKFTCIEVSKRKGWKIPFVYAAKFQVVTGGSLENEKFFEATPSGSLEVSTVTQDVFEVGRDYFLDITPVG